MPICPSNKWIKIRTRNKRKNQIKNLLKELQKDEDPSIEYNWIPTGPILSCTGCGKTFSEQKRRQAGRGDNAVKETTKGLCGFCRYNQKNELDLNKDKIAAAKANKKILEKMNPLILDYLPLTLEEIFIYEMEALGYEFKENI